MTGTLNIAHYCKLIRHSIKFQFEVQQSISKLTHWSMLAKAVQTNIIEMKNKLKVARTAQCKLHPF